MAAEQVTSTAFGPMAAGRLEMAWHWPKIPRDRVSLAKEYLAYIRLPKRHGLPLP